MTDPHPPTLTAELRAQTARAHEALDSKLTHAFEHVDQYKAFLRASYRVLSKLDPILNSLVQRPLTERCEQIAADLKRLGEPIPNVLPSIWQPPAIPEAMGCAYVIEGSRLGGLVLAKVVQRQLGLAATEYLHGKGPLTKDLWKRFMSELDAWGAHATRLERQRAAQGAAATFSAYTLCFADEGLMEAQSG